MVSRWAHNEALHPAMQAISLSGPRASQSAPGITEEFLELAKVILGCEINHKKGFTYQIQQPGADRWMSKAIYTLKLSLLQHQFPDFH